MGLREFVWVGGCVTALAAWWGVTARRRRKSVHKSAKLASRIRFGALVYTVAPLWTGEGTQECTQIGENGLSAPFRGICVHCCDARLRRVARAAPSRGRRLHRGVNTHKP